MIRKITIALTSDHLFCQMSLDLSQLQHQVFHFLWVLATGNGLFGVVQPAKLSADSRADASSHGESDVGHESHCSDCGATPFHLLLCDSGTLLCQTSPKCNSRQWRFLRNALTGEDDASCLLSPATLPTPPSHSAPTPTPSSTPKTRRLYLLHHFVSP